MDGRTDDGQGDSYIPTQTLFAGGIHITGVKPGTGPYKSSDNTFIKYNGSKTRNWTLQKFRQHIHQI